MTQPQDVLLGNMIGGCRLEARLAAGGMGVVYRAHSHKFDREVAMKILAPSLATDPEYVERFFREARAAASIEHPNIVRVLDSGKDQDRYYMILEYVRGRTLADLLAEKGRLSMEMATRIVRDIARGLEAAHAAGIIHRDIKPANILLTHDLTPKITDFGLVRQGSRPSGITLDGVFMGTPEFVSPEQAEGRKIDARGDLYSLGVTYYQLLSGAYPFYGKTAMEMALSRLREEPRPIEHAFPGVDPRAATVIKKLLRRNPNERYATASDLIRDLEAILTGKTPATATPTKKGTRRLSVFSLDAKRWMRLVSFAILYLGTLGCFGALGRVLPPRLSEALRPDFRSPGSREVLFGAGLIAFAGSMFVFRRELSGSGRGVRVGVILFLACLATAAGTARLGEIRSLLGPVQAGFGGLALATLALGWAWPKPAGESRYLFFRFLLWAALALGYVFAVGGDLAAPTRNFRDSMNLLLPLITVALVASMFGVELGVGHRWAGFARVLGIFLLAVGILGIVAFGSAGHFDLEKRVDWLSVVARPFREAARQFSSQAGALGIAYVLLALAAVLVRGRSSRR